MIRRLSTIVLALMGCAAPSTPPSPKTAADAVRPFRIRVGESVLTDLKDRLARTRWPDQIEGSGWAYGADLTYVRGLVEYWRTSFDWRRQEERLNRFPQFKTTIDGIDLHFIHQRSRHPDALPLVLTHGWPGSIAEFAKVIGPLSDPEAHGGKASDAFHVVCPSLPGFAFSGKPREPGWTTDRMAEVVSKLMERLGYGLYGAQGGDWGANVTVRLGQIDPAVVGTHINFVTAGSPPPGPNPNEGLTAEEIDRMARRRQELRDHYGYSAIQATRPLTLGYGLNDSPAGLAAWMVDKLWAWSDHGDDFEACFTKDELLTHVMLYWVNQAMPSSTRVYFEYQHPRPAPPAAGTRPRRSGRAAPMGVALFPKEMNVPPRKWVERNYNLVHWTEMPRGGHFAAMEQPALLVEDVRLFFRPIR